MNAARSAAQCEVGVDEIRESGKYRFCVTSRYGRLVDQHFGHAEEFRIYELSRAGGALIETRRSEMYCAGMDDEDEKRTRQDAVLDILRDCDAVITMRIGPAAQKRLHEAGVHTVEFFDTVEQGLRYAEKRLLRYGSGPARHFEFRDVATLNSPGLAP